MGARGPAPKPTRLRELGGNAGKRALNSDEPQPESQIPACPGHLVGEARKEWVRMAQQLFDLDLLTDVDRAALAAYCQCWARWVEAEKKIRKEGMVTYTESGYPILSPWWTVSQASLKQMRAFLVEFGMSPSSRSRVKVKTKEPEDEYAQFLRQK
ncbi:MAG: phage terminase small subunit P27 family [Caldilineaceae bacterium]